jgi:hypothetical protein
VLSRAKNLNCTGRPRIQSTFLWRLHMRPQPGWYGLRESRAGSGLRHSRLWALDFWSAAHLGNPILSPLSGLIAQAPDLSTPMDREGGRTRRIMCRERTQILRWPAGARRQVLRPILPRSLHLPLGPTEGSRKINCNKTGVRLWTDPSLVTTVVEASESSPTFHRITWDPGWQRKLG